MLAVAALLHTQIHTQTRTPSASHPPSHTPKKTNDSAVKDLEQSLLELHQIFLDMAVLVEAQGEMLDSIEKQVARSVEYVQSGTAALQDAKQLQKSTRKWMCCGIITLLIVAIIIVLVVVKPWQFAAAKQGGGGGSGGGNSG